MFSVWAFLGCLTNFVNTVVWRNNYNDSAPAWCDICEPKWHVSQLTANSYPYSVVSVYPNNGGDSGLLVGNYSAFV